MSAAAALLDRVIEELYAQHTADAGAAGAARRAYEERRGRVHQDDELWEAWSAAFVEWFVIERTEDDGLPLAARTLRELPADDARVAAIRALLTSQRSLFEVRAMAGASRRSASLRDSGRVELLDLLGGAVFHVDEQRQLHGVEVGDVAELRLIGVPTPAGGEVRFGRTFIYHPKAARGAIVERARAMLAKGDSRRDVIDQIAQLRPLISRYRHMSPARVYELGSRIMG